MYTAAAHARKGSITDTTTHLCCRHWVFLEVPHALVRSRAGVRDLFCFAVVSCCLLRLLLWLRSPSLQLILAPPRISIRLVVWFFTSARAHQLRSRGCYLTSLLLPIMVLAVLRLPRARRMAANGTTRVFASFDDRNARWRERGQR